MNPYTCPHCQAVNDDASDRYCVSCLRYEDDLPPRSVIFFPNGLAAVFDAKGRQMGRFQVGKHADTIAALAAAGFPYEGLPHVEGSPTSHPTDRLGRPITF